MGGGAGVGQKERSGSYFRYIRGKDGQQDGEKGGDQLRRMEMPISVVVLTYFCGTSSV